MCESFLATAHWTFWAGINVIVGTIAFVLIFKVGYLQHRLMQVQGETDQQQQYPNSDESNKNISQLEGTFESEPQNQPEYSPE